MSHRSNFSQETLNKRAGKIVVTIKDVVDRLHKATGVDKATLGHIWRDSDSRLDLHHQELSIASEARRFAYDSLPWAPKVTRRVLTQLRKEQRPLFVNFGDVPAEHQESSRVALYAPRSNKDKRPDQGTPLSFECMLNYVRALAKAKFGTFDDMSEALGAEMNGDNHVPAAARLPLAVFRYHSHCNNTILREVFRSGIKRQSGPGTVTDKVYDGKGRTTLGIKVDDEYGAVFSQALDNLYKLDEGALKQKDYSAERRQELIVSPEQLLSDEDFAAQSVMLRYLLDYMRSRIAGDIYDGPRHLHKKIMNSFNPAFHTQELLRKTWTRDDVERLVKYVEENGVGILAAAALALRCSFGSVSVMWYRKIRPAQKEGRDIMSASMLPAKRSAADSESVAGPSTAKKARR